MDYLQNGITVKYFVKGEERSGIVHLIDFEAERDKKKRNRNSFYIVNQFTFLENRNNRRPDIILFINGLPLVQIELKKRGVELKQAFKQIQRYQLHSFHNLFNYVQIFVISNGVNTKFFSNNSELNYNFTFFWKDNIFASCI